MNKKTLFALTLISLTLFSVLQATANAQTTSTTDQTRFTYELRQKYNPVKISVTYISSPSYAINVTDYQQTAHEERHSSSGQGLDNLMFNTSAVDVYNITFSVHYEVPIQQTVILTITEQDETSSSRTDTHYLAMNSFGFEVNIILATQQAPQQPTKEEIINGIVSGVNTLFANNFNELQSDQNNFAQSLLGSSILGNTALIVTMVLAFASFLLMWRFTRRRNHLEAK